MRTIEEIKQNTQVQVANDVTSVKGNMVGFQGFLHLRESKMTLTFMATVDSLLNGRKWEHVSVGIYNNNRNMPSWNDMCAVKDIFWRDDEEVHQIHHVRAGDPLLLGGGGMPASPLFL